MAVPPAVPLLDVNRDNAPHRDEFIDALTEVLDSGRFLFGPDVAELECELAGYCQVDNVVGCASGSDALLLALMALNIGPGDVVLSPPKLFFAYGLGNSMTFPFSVGATAILMAGRPTPAAIYERIERHRPTLLFGLPTLYRALLEEPDAERRDLSSLRLCLSAAETLRRDLFDDWRKKFGHEIVEGLGSTEMTHIYLSNHPDDKRVGSAGRVLPGYRVKLLDDDQEESDTGVMWVRGGSSAPFYWRRPARTAQTMRGEWINTGDRFHRSPDGFFFYEGRADDLIKVSGEWVHPMEIERCLAAHSDVAECAVVTVPDDDGLPRIKAIIRLREGLAPDPGITAELQRYAKKTLMPYKYPRHIEYVDSLPKTGTGKIDRQALVTASAPFSETEA